MLATKLLERGTFARLFKFKCANGKGLRAPHDVAHAELSPSNGV
jgi:hypothetical protein